MDSTDQYLESQILRDIYNNISLRLECLQNVNQAVDSISKTVGELNIKVAIKMLADKMLKEPTSDRIRAHASAILVGMADHHFNDVMYVLQKTLRSMDFPPPMVFRTLGNLASHFALKCIPFLSLTFVYIRIMIKLAMVNDIKEDICYVMENFSTAINYYYKNWRVCSFPRESESQLCSPVIPIYQHLAHDWLNDEEPKVKEASMKALWPMLGVLVRRQEQQDDIIKRIPQVLKDSRILNPFLVAKRLNLFLDVCEECRPSVPRKIFQAICDYVFHQILPSDISAHLKKGQKTDRFAHHDKNPELEKTSEQRQLDEGEPSAWDKPGFRDHEISRDHHDLLMEAFSYLVSCCPADALDFLQTQLKNDTEYTRVAILKHLKAIITSDILCETRNKKRPIVEAIKCVLDDQRETVRKAVLGFINELLRSPSVEGCAVWEMVVYVFEQFTMPVSQEKPGKESIPLQKDKEREESIQHICIDILEHLNTSAEGMSKALWPKLLYFLVPAPYTPTLTPLCRCLRELAIIRQDDSTLFLGSCKGVRLPTAQGLVARLLVLAANPNQRGNWALQLLHAVRCDIHPAFKNLWGKQIPYLWESIQKNDVDIQEWEQTLLQFLRRSLETINDSSWTQNLSRELETQMASYSDQSVEKRFLYKSLGTSLTSCEDLVFVHSRIQHYVESANYLEAPEREKVIQILSFSATGHLDLTLTILQEFGGGMHMKIRMSDIFNRYKDYTQGRRRHVHQTLMLTYGEVALHAPKELLFSRVEADIMKRVLYHYWRSCQVLGVSIANKDINLKLALIESTTHICYAIYEGRNFQDFHLACKKELLAILLNFIREEPLDSLMTPIRGKAIIAIAFLCKLRPSLSIEEIRDLLDQSIKSLFPLPPLEKLKEKGESEWGAAHIEALYFGSMDALGRLTRSVVEEHPTPELMDEMFQLIDPWFTETESSQERALQASFQALAAFQENAPFAEGEHFPQFGSLMAFLAPYTCDASPRCRQWAAQCIICLMRIEAQSRVTSREVEEMVSAYKELQSDVPSTLFKASSRMAKVVCAYFPADQALDFIEAVLEDMMSGNHMCATAAGQWLLILLEDCGGSMQTQISTILDIFYSRLPIIKEEPLRQVLVQAVCIVAHYHLEAVFSSLFSRRLPMDSETGELWRALGKDPFLASQILHELALIILIQTSTPENSITPSSGEQDREIADEEPLKATCAIYEVISMLPSEEVLQELFPELFCALLRQISKTLGQKMPHHDGRRRLFVRDDMVSEGNPCRLSVASLKALLLKIPCERPLTEIGDGNIWALLRDHSTHHEGVCLLTSSLFESGLLDHTVINDILPWMESSSEKLRLTGMAFFTEAIWDASMGERKKLKAVLPIVIERAGDQHHGIRQMAIRGLGNILLVAPDKGKEQRKTILAILLGALYDANVVLESLKVLALIFPYLKRKDVGFLFKDISIKTISYMDDDDAALRKAALNLFGVLASWTKYKYKTFFADQVKRSLMSLLIHLQDPSPRVSEACRSALLQAAKFFFKKKLRMHIEELYCTTNLNFPNLHVHICRQLVSTNPEMREELLKKTMVYCQSPWEELRRAALELTEAILENMQVTDLHEISQEELLTYLQRLQENPSLGIQQAQTDATTSVLKKWIEALKKDVVTDESNISVTAAPDGNPQLGTNLETPSVRHA